MPAALERICLRALSRVPSRRPPSAKALADDLRGYLHRRRALAGVAVALAVAALLGLGGWAAVRAWPKPPVGARPVVSIKEVTLLATVDGKKLWADVEKEPGRALPIRNGELFQVSVVLDRPGYVYLIYLDSGGESASRSPGTRAATARSTTSPSAPPRQGARRPDRVSPAGEGIRHGAPDDRLAHGRRPVELRRPAGSRPASRCPPAGWRRW
ncbi:MAG: hypothetical protein U0797_26310 [Gemmataceae bacterium]